MNRSSDVFYDLKTLLQARQGLLSGWPTPTYCDVIGASCETYDLHDHVPAYHVGGRSYVPLNLRLKESGQS
jgi:hypothetical protein